LASGGLAEHRISALQQAVTVVCKPGQSKSSIYLAGRPRELTPRIGMKKNSPHFLGILIVVGIIAAVLFASTTIFLWIGVKDGRFILLTSILILIGGIFVFGWIQSSIERGKKGKKLQPSSVKSPSWKTLTAREKFDEIWSLIQGGFIILCILVVCFLILKACIDV
jgi:hypothetical protein